MGWRQGQKIETWDEGLRQGILLACGVVGYEIQVLNRQLPCMNKSKVITLWIHQITRDDLNRLFGF